MSYVDDVAEVRARIAAEVREQRERTEALTRQLLAAMKLVDARDALIRELVAALTEFLEFGEYAYSHGREALAKAKAAGYEP